MEDQDSSFVIEFDDTPSDGEAQAGESVEELKAYIAELESTNDSLRESFGKLTEIQAMARAVSATRDIDVIFERVLEALSAIFDYRNPTLLWFDRESSEYIVDPNLSGTSEMPKTIQVHIEEGLVDWAVQKRHPTVVPASESDEEGSYVIMPFVTAGGFTAVVHAQTGLSDTKYEGQHSEMLALIASQAATAMENAKLWTETENFKDYMKDIIDSLQHGLLVLNEKNQVTFVNREARVLLGLLDQQVIGLNWIQVVPESLLQVIEDVLTEAMMNSRSEETEVNLESNGNSVFLSITGSVLTNARGEGLGTVLVFRDLAETKELTELRRVNKMKSEFVSNVSHELRTPITSIKAYTETLLEQVDEGDIETQREFLGIIDKETERLARLINDLLDLSRIERNKYELRMARNDLADLVRTVIAVFQVGAPNHKLNLTMDSRLPMFVFDRDKIHQVVSNVISNAIKYSPEGGAVDIEVKLDAREVRLSVRDHGVGLKPGDLERVFEKFFRADTNLKYEVPGTGLGLPICQYIVQSHQGRIWLESQEGKGTTAHVALPICECETSLAQQPVNEDAAEEEQLHGEPTGNGHTN